MSERFTKRTLTDYVIKRVDANTGGSVAITSTNGTGWGNPPAPDNYLLQEGTEVVLETTNGSTLAGCYVVGVHTPDFASKKGWLWRKSDEDLERSFQEWKAKWEQDKLDRVEKFRAEWEAREEKLPQVYKDRLNRFRAAAGKEEFEKEGWGYELLICELAVLYKASGGEDTDAVNNFAALYGTSGNQHGIAKLMSKHEDHIPEVPSAMAPLTGSADYAK